MTISRWLARRFSGSQDNATFLGTSDCLHDTENDSGIMVELCAREMGEGSLVLPEFQKFIPLVNDLPYIAPENDSRIAKDITHAINNTVRGNPHHTHNNAFFFPCIRALPSSWKFLARKLLTSWKFLSTVVCVVLFCLILITPVLEKVEQQNCLAILFLVSFLWATEVIPLFVTSLFVPFLVVILRVVHDEHDPAKRLSAEEASKYIIASMWTPLTILLLGAFTISAALSKHEIASRLSMITLKTAGSVPSRILLVCMFLTAFASLWITNVASPILSFSLVQPILRSLPIDSTMSKAILLGIAFSANVGGMISPIASPQNMIALQNMTGDIGWAEWFFVSLPTSVVSIILIWFLLLWGFKPGRSLKIAKLQPMKHQFDSGQWFVCSVIAVTIVLWIFNRQFSPFIGDMGVVALIPMLVFYGSGVLNKQDFENLPWSIVILAAGGISLGKAVTSSGLLQIVADQVSVWMTDLSLYSVVIIFSLLMLVIASVISHTVAAVILLPLAREVGSAMKEPHQNLLVMIGSMMASVAMSLPTSGFPNMTAVMMEDSATGVRYLRAKHLIIYGGAASIISFIVIVTVGYSLMRILGF